jgi:hypothetical protein
MPVGFRLSGAERDVNEWHCGSCPWRGR